MSDGYRRQPRSGSWSLDYKFCVLFSIENDHGSHPEHFVEEFPNTSSVKCFANLSHGVESSLVWGCRSEEKWDFHGDHFTKWTTSCPEVNTKLQVRSIHVSHPACPRTPRTDSAQTLQGLLSQIPLHPILFGCPLPLPSALNNLQLALLSPASRTGLGLLYAWNILPGMDTWMVPSLP